MGPTLGGEPRIEFHLVSALWRSGVTLGREFEAVPVSVREKDRVTPVPRSKSGDVEARKVTLVASLRVSRPPEKSDVALAVVARDRKKTPRFRPESTDDREIVGDML